MKMTEYLYSGLLLLSLVLVYFAMKQYSNTKELLNTGVKTSAEVIDLIESRGEDGYTYKPVFEYTDRTGSKMTFESDISSSPAPYQIGDYVDIIYSLDSGNRKIVSFWGLYRWTILLLSFAAPLLIIGGGYLLYARG